MNKKWWWLLITLPVVLTLMFVGVPLMLLLTSSGSASATNCGASGTPVAGAPVTATDAAHLPAAQRANAATTVAKGKQMNVLPQGIIVALATESQESSFRNLANDGTGDLKPEQKGVDRSLQFPHDGVGHDHGSVNGFQQQFPAWGTLEELMDPATAAGKFFDALLKVPGWDQMPVTVAAQTVQRSLYPSAYADDEPIARQLYTELAGTTALPAPPAGAGTAGGQGSACLPAVGNPAAGPIGVVANGVSVPLPPQAGVSGVLTFPNQAAATAAAAALSYLGTTYAWGGGGPGGPSLGIRDGGVADSFGDYNKVGFDCSGLTEYAYAKAGVQIGRTTEPQSASGGPAFPWSQALPGDLLFYGNPTHHVALYLGQVNGRQLMVEAPQSGDVVRVSDVRTGGDFRAEHVVRPTAH